MSSLRLIGIGSVAQETSLATYDASMPITIKTVSKGLEGREGVTARTSTLCKTKDIKDRTHFRD